MAPAHGTRRFRRTGGVLLRFGRRRGERTEAGALPDEAPSPPIVFFGGKGGVGKTTCASAVALAASRIGKRVLLVSTDPAHSTSDVLGIAVGGVESEILPSLSALEIDSAAEARQYVSDVRERAAALFGPGATRALQQIDMAASMPGIEDAALFDRIADKSRFGFGDLEVMAILRSMAERADGIMLSAARSRMGRFV